MTTLVTINTLSLLILRNDARMYTEHSTYGTETKSDIQYLNDLTSALYEASVHLDTAQHYSKSTVEVTARTIKFLLKETTAMLEHFDWKIEFADLIALEKTRDITQAILHAMEVLEAVDAKDEPEATLKEVA